jgi:hypothetical protein
VILRDQLLEVSNGDGRLHVPRKPDERDPPIAPMTLRDGRPGVH